MDELGCDKAASTSDCDEGSRHGVLSAWERSLTSLITWLRCRKSEGARRSLVWPHCTREAQHAGRARCSPVPSQCHSESTPHSPKTRRKQNTPHAPLQKWSSRQATAAERSPFSNRSWRRTDMSSLLLVLPGSGERQVPGATSLTAVRQAAEQHWGAELRGKVSRGPRDGPWHHCRRRCSPLPLLLATATRRLQCPPRADPATACFALSTLTPPGLCGCRRQRAAAGRRRRAGGSAGWRDAGAGARRRPGGAIPGEGQLRAAPQDHDNGGGV